MSRITPAFDRLSAEHRTGLIAYITAGYPTLAETPTLVRALVEGGADLVELGVPFSDPLADGATVQRATHVAVEQGVTLADVLGVCRALRAAGIEAPLVAMTYLNPILAYGLDRFAADAAKAGLDGVIPVDVPPEEGAALKAALAAHELDVIYLLAPTSTEERVARVTAESSGFVYCVSVVGTTGARGELPPDLAEFIARARRHTSLPLAVGFGVSKPEHVAQIGRLCEAAVIGSAIIDTVEQAPPEQRADRLREYIAAVTGRQSSAGTAPRG